MNLLKIVFIAAMTALTCIAQPGYASGACAVEKVKPLNNPCLKRDHHKFGKAHAVCNARIVAPKGYFIMDSDTVVNFSGSNHIRSKNVTKIPYVGLKAGLQKQFFAKTLHSSVSAWVECKRIRGYLARSTCTAAVRITAKAYPHACLNDLIRKALR